MITIFFAKVAYEKGLSSLPREEILEAFPDLKSILDVLTDYSEEYNFYSEIVENEYCGEEQSIYRLFITMQPSGLLIYRSLGGLVNEKY